MNTRCVNLFVPATLALVLFCVGGLSNSQEPQESPTPISSVSKALKFLKADEGTWDAAVTLWLRPGSAPIKSRAVVTAHMALSGMY